MKKIETSVIINAPVQEVWKIFMDFARYPEWNPFIQLITGDSTRGSQLEVHLKLEGSKIQVFKPKVLKCRKEKEFRWLGKLFVKGLFDGEHYFLLEPLEKGRTQFIQGEIFKGILAGPILKMVGKSTREGFMQMNITLKRKVENGSR